KALLHGWRDPQAKGRKRRLRPHRMRSRVRCPAFGSYRTMGKLSVGATFQLGGKFGVGYSGGTRKAILISLTLAFELGSAAHGSTALRMRRPALSQLRACHRARADRAR